MHLSIWLILYAAITLALWVLIPRIMKILRKKYGKDRYKLPDKIPLLPALTNIPDKSSFIQAGSLLESGVAGHESSREQSTVTMLMTDEGVLQNGFSLEGDSLILKCESPHGTLWHEVRSLPLVIGKSEDCDLQLAEEPHANHLHGILFAKEGRYFYLDMNSMDGSIVDGVLASGVKEIQNGSCIQICHTTIFFITQYTHQPNEGTSQSPPAAPRYPLT